jgi:anthranilate phosphoribosyltransferase
VTRMARSALAGGDAAYNSRALAAILAGEAHPAREAVVLNAAAALCVATGESPRACAERARGAISDGASRNKLDQWRRAAQRARGG